MLAIALAVIAVLVLIGIIIQRVPVLPGVVALIVLALIHVLLTR